jgi:hypothetical protein
MLLKEEKALHKELYIRLGAVHTFHGKPEECDPELAPANLRVAALLFNDWMPL